MDRCRNVVCSEAPYFPLLLSQACKPAACISCCQQSPSKDPATAWRESPIKQCRVLSAFHRSNIVELVRQRQVQLEAASNCFLTRMSSEFINRYWQPSDFSSELPTIRSSKVANRLPRRWPALFACPTDWERVTQLHRDPQTRTK